MKSLFLSAIFMLFGLNAIAEGRDAIPSTTVKCTSSTVSTVERENGQRYDDENSYNTSILLDGNEQSQIGSGKIQISKKSKLELTIAAYKESGRTELTLEVQLGKNTVSVTSQSPVNMKINSTQIVCEVVN
ncbi:MAG: hypothetical protein ACXVCR_16360 [Bdellovibrio sp.]